MQRSLTRGHLLGLVRQCRTVSANRNVVGGQIISAVVPIRGGRGITRTCWVSLLVVALQGCIGTDLVEESALTIPEIHVSQSAIALLQGDEVALTATYVDAFGNEDPFVMPQWFSGDPGIATVADNGVVRGTGVGQTTVAVTVDTTISPAVLVTVVADASSAASVTISPDSLALTAGEEAQLTAIARNIAGDAISPATVVWESNDVGIAEIDASGRIVAVAPGSAVVVARVDGIASPPAIVIVRGRVRTGTFVKRPGTSYNVSGGAELAELPSGRLRLTLGSDFISSDGPDVDVYLSQTNTVTGASLSLGSIISSSGEQEYAVPSGVDLDEYDWVIIHCVAFNVTFGYARLF